MSRKLPPAEEATPLLLDGIDKQAQEPFPYRQIIPLCFARLLEAWTFWTVFPFVPALLKRSGIPEPDLGYFAGLIEGIFSATQVVTMLLLGTISERWGRKSVLCFCLLGLSICSTCFGFATSVWQMLLFRSGSGIFSACTVTTRIMISESTTGEATAKGFSYITVAQSIAQIAAPTIGGLLWAGDQAASPILARYPAILPCIINGAIGIITLISTLLFVKETRPNGPEAAKQDKQMSYLEILRQPQVASFMLLYIWEWSQGSAVRAIQSLSWFTGIKYGGWSLSVREISWISGSLGAVGITWSILFFPRVHTKLGVSRMLMICSLNYIGIHFWATLSNHLLRWHRYKIFYLLCPPFLIVQSILGCSCAIAIQLFFNDIAPAGALGPMYSLAYGLGAGQRAIVPAAVTSLMAYGMKRQILDGCLAFVVLGAMGICYAIALRSFLRRHACKV